MFAGYCQNLDELIPTSHHDSPTVVPKFVSRGHLYKAIVGDTIELPCKVQNLGNKYTFFGIAKIKRNIENKAKQTTFKHIQSSGKYAQSHCTMTWNSVLNYSEIHFTNSIFNFNCKLNEHILVQYLAIWEKYTDVSTHLKHLLLYSRHKL